MPGAGAGLLEAPDDLPEDVAFGRARVGALAVVERDPGALGVEVDLALGDGGERGDPGDEAGLSGAVRRHPQEAADLRPGEVHQDRLGEVVEVEPEHEQVGRGLPGGRVEEAAPPDTAERAGRDPRQPLRRLVGGGPDRVPGSDDRVGDAEPIGQRPRALDGLRPVSRQSPRRR